ncbi:MAG: CGLD27 family protein [Cyanobacteriota bacterium]|nr:CGLD27 family protein [Cyanobacteriota bacterium]
MTAVACPVPPEQRPLREYEQLKQSWFFVWPAETLNGLIRPLAISWLMLLPVTLVVASGSWVLRHDPARLALSAAVAAIALPVLLLVRQWLGWSYVHRRLISERVEYEESGWYDGQVWEKPLSWRQQDLLVATHQVRPVLLRLQQAIGMAACLMLLGASVCQAF